ncbi:hypothetical protein BGZ63DRAFT_354006 [Mariannaea sp. PMI_226]|nr:hypothetical protein BGZ63DRAFT_354006 [Mariannaea sp. PMI_226]
MLERTAVGLESCTLQRVLPKPTKSTRRLHTAFWQHGASAIDLSQSWPGLPRAAENPSSPQQPQSTLMASAFLLDFLYPSNTLPLLRKLYPRLPRSEDDRQTSHALRRRAFSSSTADPRPDLVIENRASLERSVLLNHGYSTPQSDQLRHLYRLLADERGNHYGEIWDLYTHLGHAERLSIRADVIMYLVQSHGIVENGRALSVFRQIPIDEWDNEILASGILLFLRTGDLKSAMQQFYIGLEAKGLTGGLEYLLADAITSRRWKLALDVWIAYYTSEVKRLPRIKPTTERLKELKGIPDQGHLYFAFRSYLSTDGAEYQRQIKDVPVSYEAFRSFRRHFAETALRQPCAPDQAALILDTLRDKNLYNEYFELMLSRWYGKLETRSSINKLPDMYEKFKELPNAIPTMNVIRGLFKIYFPKNIVGLEQLYTDWIRWKGGLNRWGYEKFLKLYASRGNVELVEKLWTEFVNKYPDMLETPRGFRSILNVYAQTGNSAEVERIMKEMVEKYDAGTDIDCYNTLLKAYVKDNEYEKVLSCFDEVSQIHTPDSWTYAHAMAMSSKKGDLETTLDFFNKSQEANVAITKEMTLSLVVAYCQNELLQEAETLCFELAQRGLTHTATWNQLLNFNGEARNLTKCYMLLERMKQFGIEWDEDTHRFLLQALVNVDQIHAAYTLLKGAEEQDAFVVSPEHHAIVMAGAARCGQHALVDSLHYRMQKLNVHVNFNALVAVVESAAQQKPGAERTLKMSKELVEHFRRSLSAESGQLLASESEATAIQRGRFHVVGRAIALLVQLRQFGTAEELMTLFNEMFPQYKEADQYPVNVMSALMTAHYLDGDLDKTLELWGKVWEGTLENGRKRSGKGVYAGHEYDISRAITVAMKAFRDKNDASGLSNCIDDVTKEGFKLTNANWSLAVRYLSELGRWERAMHWCETKLMPGWQGWSWGRTSNDKALFRNTRALRAPKNIVFRLQQEWLKFRKIAAWDAQVSRQLDNVQTKYPRLYQAFTTSDIQTLQLTHQVDASRKPVRDLDKILRSMPYAELMKAKESLLKQLMRERRREKRLGIEKPTSDPKEQEEWKQELQARVRRYATTWAARRAKQFTSNNRTAPREETASVSDADPDEVIADERSRYWNGFFDRYDQSPHGGQKFRTPVQSVVPRLNKYRGPIRRTTKANDV